MSAGDRVESDIVLRPALGRTDLRPCAVCGKGVLHTRLPLCWRVTIERFGFDGGAIRRAVAMEDYFASPALADVFSTGEPMAKRIIACRPALVCEQCSMRPVILAAIAERDSDSEATEEARDEVRP